MPYIDFKGGNTVVRLSSPWGETVKNKKIKTGTFLEAQ